jgi:hypothetical protein
MLGDSITTDSFDPAYDTAGLLFEPGHIVSLRNLDFAPVFTLNYAVFTSSEVDEFVEFEII